MHKFAFGIVVLALTVGAWLAVAQEGGQVPEVDEALFSRGGELFQTNCVVCHQSSGQGNPPMFPALAGNAALQDPSLIVTNISQGKGAMPAFRQLGIEEIAALATYIRNEWGNDFGGVTPQQVEAQIEVVMTLRSVWEGVYTAEQAKRGDRLYSGGCSECHGFLWVRTNAPVVAAAPAPVRGDVPILLYISAAHADKSDPPVAPELSGEKFLTRWQGQTISSLYLFVRQSMPQLDPGSLSDQEYIDIIAFLLAVNDIPAGQAELVPDLSVLNDIVIAPAPAE